jgi:hypothetical protein
MRISSVPAPSILAPIAFRQSARLTTSGSRAGFAITVSPLASDAAISATWVAPTDTLGNDIRADKPVFGFRMHVAAIDLDLGAQRLERFDEQVDRPRADGAAAGQRHDCLAHARQQGPDHPETRPHLRDQLVGGRDIDDVARCEMHRARIVGSLRLPAAGHGIVDAVVGQDADQRFDVGQMRHVFQRQRVVGEQARDHQRQAGVLRAGNRNDAVKRIAAGNPDLVHEVVPNPLARPAVPGGTDGFGRLCGFARLSHRHGRFKAATMRTTP